MHSSHNITGKLPMILLGLALCGLPIIFLVVMPNFVPEHRIVQTQFFGVFGITALLAVVLSFAWGPRYYFVVISMAIPVLPYFAAYLAPLGGPILSATPEMGLALLCLLLIAVWVNQNRVEVTPINAFIALWVLFNGLSLIFSRDLMGSLPLFGVTVVFSAVFLFMVHNIILRYANGLQLVLTVFVLANCLFIIFGFVVTGAVAGWSSLTDLSMFRLGSNVNTGSYGSNGYAAMMLLSLPIFFWVLVINPKFVRIPKILLWPIFASSVLMVLFSVSRGNIIALVITLFIFAVYMLRTFYKGRSLIGLAILLGVQAWVVSSTYYVQMLVLRLVDEKQFSLQNILQHSMKNIRVVLAQVSWDVFRDNWLFGVGQGNLTQEINLRSGINFDAHNLALNILAEQGAPVFLLLVALLSYTTYLTWRAVRTKGPGDRWLAVCGYTALTLFLLSSCLTGGILSSSQFIGGHRVCWMFTLIAIIYHVAKSPQALTGGEAAPPVQESDRSSRDLGASGE